MKSILVLLVLLAVAACTSQHPGRAAGTPFALNQGQWQPTAADLDVQGD